MAALFLFIIFITHLMKAILGLHAILIVFAAILVFGTQGKDDVFGSPKSPIVGAGRLDSGGSNAYKKKGKRDQT